MEEIARGIDGRLLALTGGQSVGPARHRTLEAVLGWSHDLLSEAERDRLCRVSVFQGAFAADAAARVLELPDGAAARAALTPLVETSLVASDGADFRLLDVTRSYARRRLDRHPRAARVRALHARVCIDGLATADADLLTQDRTAWSRTYGPMTGDVSAALGWCFSPAGDAALGTELAARSTQIALQSGLGTEFRRHFAAALARADGVTEARDVAGLRYAFAIIRADETGTSAPYRLDLPEPDRAPASPEAGAALFAAAYLDGDYPAAARHAEALARLGRAEGDRGVALAGSRMLAQALHHLGRHREAERLARPVLRNPLHFLPLTNVPQRVSMRIILARIAFLKDRLPEARALAREALAAALESNGPSVCQVLTQATIPLAVWTGDGDAAADVDVLRKTAHDLRLHYWIVWLEGLEIALASLDADPERRGQLLFALSLRRLPAKLADQIATFDPSLLTPETAGRVAAGTVGWCAPEVLRAEASRAADPGERRVLLRRAAAQAAEQGGTAWSRRIEADLAGSEAPPVRLRET